MKSKKEKIARLELTMARNERKLERAVKEFRKARCTCKESGRYPKKVASKALRDPSTPSEEKTLAGSVLSQSPRKKRRW